MHTAWPEEDTATKGSKRSGDDAQARWLCVFEQSADWPHYSYGDVSVHGTWHVLWGTCPTSAHVTVWLQQEECPTPYWCRWTKRGQSATATVSEGGGSGNRATARVPCSSSNSTRWRGVVDVDLIGYFDEPFVTYGDAAWVNCRV